MSAPVIYVVSHFQDEADARWVSSSQWQNFEPRELLVRRVAPESPWQLVGGIRRCGGETDVAVAQSHPMTDKRRRFHVSGSGEKQDTFYRSDNLCSQHMWSFT